MCSGHRILCVSSDLQMFTDVCVRVLSRHTHHVSKPSEVQVHVCTHRRVNSGMSVCPRLTEVHECHSSTHANTQAQACHLHICSRSLRCTHPQRHVLVYRVCAHLRPLNVCVCTSSGGLCVHRPRGPRTDTRFFSPTDLHPSPTTRERSSSRPISAHSHLRALELGHTHMLRALKACVRVLNPTVVYTHVHTQSQVNTDPRGRS